MVQEQENTVVVQKESGEKEKQSKDSIQPYDFRHPSFLSATELRKLRLSHEEFIRALAARLSIYLRLEVNLQMSKLQTITYQKFVDGLSNPTHLALFKVEPMRGIGVMEIPPRLGLTIVDRLLGGPAHSVNADHDLSEIELALLEQSVELILGEWCNHWAKVQELRPVLLGHETNGRFLQTAPHDTVMLVLAIEARVGDCVEQLQMAFPCHTLEPLIRKLSDALDSSVSNEAIAQIKPLKWNRQFEDVAVPVTAVWKDLELTARAITQLKVGDVLDVDPAWTQQVEIRLARIPKFVGQLGTVGGKWAISIHKIIKQ
jgi:flagellar motor switch protein FliM